jgi:hypothetical protein
MNPSYVATLIAVFSLVPVFASETQQRSINFDIWYVPELVQELSKENFFEREEATRRLIALGPAVISEINTQVHFERADAETRERLLRVLRDAEFAHLSTFEIAAAEYERLAEDIAGLNPEKQSTLFEEKRARADRVLARMESLPVAGDRDWRIADLLATTGELLFRATTSTSRTPTLRCAIADLQSAIYLYEKAQLRSPGNSALSTAMNRASALLGSAQWMDTPRFE